MCEQYTILTFKGVKNKIKIRTFAVLSRLGDGSRT